MCRVGLSFTLFYYNTVCVCCFSISFLQCLPGSQHQNREKVGVNFRRYDINTRFLIKWKPHVPLKFRKNLSDIKLPCVKIKYLQPAQLHTLSDFDRLSSHPIIVWLTSMLFVSLTLFIYVFLSLGRIFLFSSIVPPHTSNIGWPIAGPG